MPKQILPIRFFESLCEGTKRKGILSLQVGYSVEQTKHYANQKYPLLLFPPYFEKAN